MKYCKFLIIPCFSLSLSSCTALTPVRWPATSQANGFSVSEPHRVDFFSECAKLLNAITVDVQLEGPGGGAWSGSGKNPFTEKVLDNCRGYTVFNYPMYPLATTFWVDVGYDGDNVTTSEFDCNHTNVEFAVFVRRGSDFFSLVSYGLVRGLLIEGTCTHGNAAAEAFPAINPSYAAPPFGIQNPTTAIHWGTIANTGEIRVMARSWAHNDPNIGHPGNLSCAPSTSCWYGASVLIRPFPGRFPLLPQ